MPPILDHRRRSLTLGAAALLFAGVFALRVGIQDPGQTVTLLYILPIVLVAVELGVRWGLAASGLALGLFALWDVTWAASADHALLDYLGRGAAFLILGGMIGAFADRVRTASGERARFWDLSSDLLCTVGFDGYYRRLNPAWENTLGWTLEELRARPARDFVHPDDREATGERVEQLRAAGGKVRSWQYRILAKDGSYRSLLWSANSAPDEGLIYAVAKDVTDRAEADERLRSSEEFLDSVLENIPNMVFVKDADELRFVRLNRAGEELLGRSREEMIGKNDYDFFPEEEADFFTQKDREVLASGKILDIPEESIETGEKGPRTLHTRKIAIRDEQGEPKYLLGASEDITDRKLAEQRLREQEGRTRQVLDDAHDAFVSIDAQGVITAWNSSAEAIFGWSREEALGRVLAETIIPPQHREAHTRGLERFLASGEGQVLNKRMELTALHRDRGQFPVELTISPLEGPDGYSFHAFLQDITERKRIEGALADAKEEAERANRAKSEFLSRMSHELRTPLNAIIGFSQLLELDELEPKQSEGVEQILKGGRHLLKLIDEVLDISRIESGTIGISLEPVHLGSALAEALSLIAPLAKEAKVSLDPDLSELENDYVLADQQRLKQVLINLLSNAVKYNREGGSVKVTRERPSAARVGLALTDTGRGMSEAQLEVLFSPFERLGAERTEIEGTGLGLALSKHLVEVMGGTIEAESELGIGTTMRVEFDVAESPKADEKATADNGAAGGDGAPRERRTVLYVEDNPSSVRLVEQALKRLSGVRLIPAMHGNLGLELVRRHRPDLVLLDLHLPDLDGHQILTRLKEDPATADIPVVMVSADATAGQIERLRAAGAAEYLTKPIDVQRLLELVAAASA